MRPIFYFFPVNFVKRIFFKTLRFAAIIAIVYLCLVGYLLLSERRLSFARAESDKTSADTIKEYALRCQTKDGKWLQGWVSKDSLAPTVLYFADRGEDAATFLAHAMRIPGFRFAGFNYRGSAGSEGSPGEKHYAEDIRAMVGCANAEGAIFLGHGTGAIAAYNSFKNDLGRGAVLVDPVESFGDALSSRYRVFFPRFLSRTKTQMEFDSSAAPQALVIFDDPRKGAGVESLIKNHPEAFHVLRRDGASLLDVLEKVLGEMAAGSRSPLSQSALFVNF